MTTTPPRGVICPLATPLTEDEQLDAGALRALLDHVLGDVDGVLALGSSGEAAVLQPAVAEEVVETVLEHVDGRVPVFVGAGESGTARAIANARRLEQSGIAGLFVCGPYYYDAVDAAALGGHFEAVADAAGLPVVLYNIPQNTGAALAREQLERLARHPNVVALKDSGGDMFAFQAYLEAVPASFPVLQGREQLAAASVWLGAAGVISALANIAPAALRGVVDAVARGDRDAALAAQRAVTDLASLFDAEHWLSALKAALAELGIGNGAPAAPARALSAAGREAVRVRLEAHDLLPSATARR